MIKSGIFEHLSCALQPNIHFEFSFRGHVVDDTGETLYTEVINGIGKTISGSSISYFSATENYTSGFGSLSASIDGSGNLVCSLGSENETDQKYVIFGSISTWAF